MIGFADPQHRTSGSLSFDPYVTTLAYLALSLAYSGYVDQARIRMEQALSEARRLKHSHTLAHALCFATWLHWLLCLPMVYTEEYFALTTAHGFPFYLGLAIAFRGRSLITLRQTQEGVALLAQGLAESRETGAVVFTSVLLTWLAEAYSMLGQSVDEQNCLAEAARIIESTDERVSEAELLHRVPGALLSAKDDPSGPERFYRQAIAVAEQQSAKLFQLRASVSLARLWCVQGKSAEARELLGSIYNWFTEGFDAPDLKEAKALLEELT